MNLGPPDPSKRSGAEIIEYLTNLWAEVKSLSDDHCRAEEKPEEPQVIHPPYPSKPTVPGPASLSKLPERTEWSQVSDKYFMPPTGYRRDGVPIAGIVHIREVPPEVLKQFNLATNNSYDNQGAEPEPIGELPDTNGGGGLESPENV